MFMRAVPSNPALLQGLPAGTNTGYESKAQMLQDQKDPRYAADPAFRQKVMDKFAISFKLH